MRQLHDISAELLLQYLYPELQDQWSVQSEGTFYRNYNTDVLSVDAEHKTVSLARDGMLSLLPQGLFSDENELREKDSEARHKEAKDRERRLRSAFAPFDSFAFRHRLHIEQQISELLSGANDYILELLGFVPKPDDDPWVRKLARLLPMVKTIRGDEQLIRIILSTITEYPVELSYQRWSETDDTVCWIPWLRYRILAENLSPQQFNELYSRVKTVEDFVREWFVPAEAHLQIDVCHHNAPQMIGGDLILNYNLEIK